MAAAVDGLSRPVPAPARRAVLALVAIAALAATRLPLILAGPDLHLSWMMDDASYYLEGSRRAVESHAWPSMDGREPTNGFHPLYMLVLVALQAGIGTEPRVVVPVVMGIQLLLGAGAVWILWRRQARGATSSAAIAVALLLALDPGWTEHGLCGVENGLSSLLLLALVLRWERAFGPDATGARTMRSWITDGLLLGLAIAARTDSALFAVPWLAFGGWRSERRAGTGTAISGVALAGLAALAVLAPWIVMNLLRFGTVLQDSSVALSTRYARTYGPYTGPDSLKVSATILGFWWFRALWAGGLVPLTGWALGLSLPHERGRRLGLWAGWIVASLCVATLVLRANDTADIRDVKVAALEVGLGTAAFLAGAFSRRPPSPRAAAVFPMLATYAVLTVFAYAFGFRGFQVWYSTGLCLVAVLLPAAGALANALSSRRALAAALVALMAVQAVLVTRELYVRGMREGVQRTALADGAALRARLERFTALHGDSVRFACFDSGELSYVTHPFPILNADGVMDHGAALALRDDRLASWLHSRGITHLVGSAARVTEFASIAAVYWEPDTSASRQLGVETQRLMR